MPAPNALSVAVDMALRQRDDARRVLQDKRGARQSAQAQMDQLQGYAQETQNRWGVRANASLAPEVMFHHYQFMDRLNHAMGLQTSVVLDHAGRVEAAQQALLAAELRLTSLKKLMEKRLKEAEQAQMRREQKQTDERAALQHGRSFTGL
jgi:flagellar FliJ protein